MFIFICPFYGNIKGLCLEVTLAFHLWTSIGVLTWPPWWCVPPLVILSLAAISQYVTFSIPEHVVMENIVSLTGSRPPGKQSSG